MENGTREEEELTIQIPTNDGSQTERAKGTFGGRQRWISNDKTTHGVPVSATTRSTLLSPRPGSKYTKVSAPSVQPFLSSMGIVVGEENHIVDKEINELSVVRREYDQVRNQNMMYEKEIHRLEEDIEAMRLTFESRLSDDTRLRSVTSTIESKTSLYESKVEEELADRNVYNHMIQRLTEEALEAKKKSMEYENKLSSLQSETQMCMTALLNARKEKSTADNAYKTMYTKWWDRRQENSQALADMEIAVNKTKLTCDITEKREISRKQQIKDALIQQQLREQHRLKLESSSHRTKVTEVQEELSEMDEKLFQVEGEMKKIIEAAGTNAVDKIILKFINRDDTLRLLQEEYTIAEARMRKLKEKHKQLSDQLTVQRSSEVKPRTIYQEMDQTSEILKDIEKNAMNLSEKINRCNLVIDACRACYYKSITKLSSVQGSNEDENQHEVHLCLDSNPQDLLLVMEQKLNRVLDIINREKIERELHCTEGNSGSSSGPLSITSNHGHHTDSHGKDGLEIYPLPSETEEHFILRKSIMDTSPTNVRVQAKLKHSEDLDKNRLNNEMEDAKFRGNSANRVGSGWKGTLPQHENHHDNLNISDSSGHENHVGDDDNELIIDRQMRKKLVGLVVGRGKRSKKVSQT